jgi:hypothetical protein
MANPQGPDAYLQSMAVFALFSTKLLIAMAGRVLSPQIRTRSQEELEALRKVLDSLTKVFALLI